MRILVVEDEALIRAVMCDALTEAGFAVSEAEDGVSALAKFRRNGADLLFTDIRLPGPLDGWSLADQLRSLAPELPAIFASGYVEVEPHEILNSRFVRKPYSPSAVIREMRILLGAQQPESAYQC
jgi:CheY-like chemotaxis protein